MINIKYINNNELREMLKDEKIRKCAVIYFQDNGEEKIEFWKLKIAPVQSVIVPVGGITDEIRSFLSKFIDDNKDRQIICAANDPKDFEQITGFFLDNIFKIHIC